LSIKDLDQKIGAHLDVNECLLLPTILSQFEPVYLDIVILEYGHDVSSYKGV